MDDSQFDSLTRALARPQPRRRLFGALAAGLLGGLGGARLVAARPRVLSFCDDYCSDTGDRRDQCLDACRECDADATNLCKGANGLVACCDPRAGFVCRPNEGQCCEVAERERTCSGRCGTVTGSCGESVDCTDLCAGRDGQCCGDGLCADGHDTVCCGDARCSGECCGNGLCASRDSGAVCCGDAPCRGECRNGVCRTEDAGCLAPNAGCLDPRVCFDNGTCALPCDSADFCVQAGCQNSTCLSIGGQAWCTSGSVVGECHRDADCPLGSICLNGNCITTC